MEGGQFEIVGIIVAFIGSVASSKDEHLILLHLASRVEGTAQRHVTRTLFQCPFHSLVVDDPKSIEVVLGKEILGIVEFFGLLQPTEQVVRLADSHDGVAGSRRRHVTRLLDLLPGDGSRHSNKR